MKTVSMTIDPRIPASFAVGQIDAAQVDAEQYSKLTREALNDVDAGNVIDHQSVQAWAESLGNSCKII